MTNLTNTTNKVFLESTQKSRFSWIEKFRFCIWFWEEESRRETRGFVLKGVQIMWFWLCIHIWISISGKYSFHCFYKNIFPFLLSVAFFQSLANWTQSCLTILDTIIIAHMLFAVWSHWNHIKTKKKNASWELFYDSVRAGVPEYL